MILPYFIKIAYELLISFMTDSIRMVVSVAHLYI